MFKEPIVEQSGDTYYGLKVKGALKIKTKKEKVDDFAWVPDRYNHILTATEKMIRIYDIERVEEDVGHVALKKEKGLLSKIAFDPNNSSRFLVFYGNEISLWDLAHLKEPILTFRNCLDQYTMHVDWISKEPDLLASTFSGKTAKPVMSFWHTKESNKDGKNMRPVKTKYIGEGNAISSFDIVPNTLDILNVLYSVRLLNIR